MSNEVKLSVIRLKEVLRKTGLSRSTIYAYIADDMFPKPFKIGLRAVGWYEHDIDEWIANLGGFQQEDSYEGL